MGNFKINLSEEQTKLLGEFLTASDEPAEVSLSIGNGHSGYGLYVWEAEYPEEGATFIASMTDPADPFGDKDLPLDSHEQADARMREALHLIASTTTDAGAREEARAALAAAPQPAPEPAQLTDGYDFWKPIRDVY